MPSPPAGGVGVTVCVYTGGQGGHVCNPVQMEAIRQNLTRPSESRAAAAVELSRESRRNDRHPLEMNAAL